MLKQLFRATLPGILVGTVALQPAHADIYTWTDASGRMTISNLAPPEGVRVTNVLHESPPKVATSNDTARNAAREAEVQALAERVRQLENEAELARRPAPPQAEYRTVTVPPLMPYGIDIAPPPPQYAVNMAPPTIRACDPTWIDCGLGWGPIIYPPSVVVLRASNFRHFAPIHHGRHVGPQRPVQVSGNFRTR